jgi:hypothetical protein
MEWCIFLDKVINLFRNIENYNDNREQQDGIKVRPQEFADNININFF